MLFFASILAPFLIKSKAISILPLKQTPIKAVLPALVPSLSYDNLDIKDGGSASTIFMQMVNGTYDDDYEKIKDDLLAYCKLDTWAMVEILNRLKE